MLAIAFSKKRFVC